MCHLWHNTLIIQAKCSFEIFSLAGIRVGLSKPEIPAQLCVCPDIAVGRQILGMQGESVEQAPIRAVFFGKIAVGHGNEHPGRQQSPIKNLEQLTVDVSKRRWCSNNVVLPKQPWYQCRS